MVRINGIDESCAGSTLTGYLSGTAFDPARIAVEKNGEIVPKSQYDATILRDGDVLEIVSFVGGG